MKHPGTFSITARCPRTGQFGVAVASKYLAVGAVVPFVQAGVGAVATQARGRADYGPRALDLMARGMEPEEVLKELRRDDPEWEYRQVHMVDSTNHSACHTGSSTSEWAGHQVAQDCTVAGNILTGPEVLKAMLKAFLADPDQPLAVRLMAALLAGDEVGGDRRGKQSAALVVADSEPYPIVNVRADDHPEAPSELKRVFDLYCKTFPKNIR
jgi:uncharacterized Ntn-hydrolase superfamily protein